VDWQPVESTGIQQSPLDKEHFKKRVAGYLKKNLLGGTASTEKENPSKPIKASLHLPLCGYIDHGHKTSKDKYIQLGCRITPVINGEIVPEISYLYIGTDYQKNNESDKENERNQFLDALADGDGPEVEFDF
jgi:hypothetical protein